MPNTNLHIRHQLIFTNLKLEKHYGSNKYKMKRKIMFSYNYFKVSMARVQEDNNNDGQVQQDNNIVTQM